MRRRAVVLPTVLFVLLLLGVFGAMYAFRTNADMAATKAVAFRMQTRLAAEAGLEYVKMMLRTDRANMDRWYHNPEEMNRILVWAYDVDPSMLGMDEDLDEGATAYRFSVVGDDPTDDEEYIRFGITDESSKLNLNLATFDQLLILVRAALGEENEVDPREIVAAVMDWRDPDANPQGEAGDTEGLYYEELESPYQIKNGPFDTVEELLLVKGITPRLMYGEDFDRNGILTANEDDGDDTFPPDNQDNALNRGLYPYLTVSSYESNVSNDNRKRIYLFGDENQVREELTEVFEDEPDVVDYIVQVTRGGGGRAPAPGGGQPGNTDTGPADPGDASPAGEGNTDNENVDGDNKADTRRQVRDDGSDDPEEGSDSEAGDDENADPNAAEEGDENPDEDEETNDAQPPSGPIRTPASLLLPRSISGELREGPVGPEHLATLLDYTTTERPEVERLTGLINVNTAPALVLRCLDLTEEQVRAIIDIRGALSGAEKATPAWLVTERVLDPVAFESLAPRITGRGQQFTIEVLGFADHVGMVTRLQAMVDMVGPVAQVLYVRDLTSLGVAFPIREEDKENIRVR